MRARLSSPHPISIAAMAVILSVGLISLADAQSQEPKPVLPATPVAESDLVPLATPVSGVRDASWEGPNWGVRVSWDPADWTVESEFVEPGYDGLQIGTPRSTAYIEAYEGFGGDARTCLLAATAEIGQREGVSEVVPLSDRPLPVTEEEVGEAQLFGVTATLADGTAYRGVEYVECRTLVPGVAVLELTWQTLTTAFNEDFPLVEKLFAAIALPAEVAPAGTPAGTPIAALATPVA